MWKNLLKIATSLIFIIIILQSINFVTASKVYDIIVCSDSTRFNPSENISFSIYFIGIREISYDYLFLYMDDKIYLEHAKHFGEISPIGKTHESNVAIMTNFSEIVKDFGLEFGDLYKDINLNGSYVAPIDIVLATESDVSPGEHILRVVFLYEDDDGVIQMVSDSISFYINTVVEQVAEETLQWSRIEPYFLTFLAFLSALVVYSFARIISKKEGKKRKKEFGKKMLLMIKDEVEFNKVKVKNIKNTKKNSIPIDRVKVDNKDASWSKIVEYWDKEFDLITEISDLYYIYSFLNRTIDDGFAFFVSSKKVPSGLSKEIKRICIEIENITDKLLPKLKQF